ncbi:hypothetical protein M413DRAFT_195007 [Hebeloma cylindrosporum]|uniref:Uncharacterized protein n=1 Tax=Hebeloma cylindrosporum TaxID=76867 RepID=A0A0C2YF74_HEBCY|nr:hypothetical protein M413DRAFT_195007 [Hebeloma cylindrosporum h7]
MVVDIDLNESAVFSFNLALYLRRAFGSPQTQIVQVWHVTLELDHQSHGTSLSATNCPVSLGKVVVTCVISRFLVDLSPLELQDLTMSL